MNNINICFTCDNTYSQYAGVTIASILKNAAADDNLSFYIISYDISEDNKNKILNLKNIKNCNITFITPAADLFCEFEGIKTIDYLPLVSFFRLKLSSLLPNIDKVIYLDPDIIVNSSLAGLFNIDIDNYYCGGVLDINHKKLGKQINLKTENSYINSGMLLINLKKWRDENAEKQFNECAKHYIKEIAFGDQDLINMCFDGKILILDYKWNMQVVNLCCRSEFTDKFNIIHYTGSSKPWKFGSYVPLKKYYFEALKLTGWKFPNKRQRMLSEICGILLYLKQYPFFIFSPNFIKALFTK